MTFGTFVSPSSPLEPFVVSSLTYVIFSCADLLHSLICTGDIPYKSTYNSHQKRLEAKEEAIRQKRHDTEDDSVEDILLHWCHHV